MGLFQKRDCGGSMLDGTGCKNCATCIEVMKANFEHQRQQLVRLRQRTHDIQRAESTRYGKLQKSIYGYTAQLSVGAGYVKRGQDWFWDEEKVEERPLHLSQNHARIIGLLVGRMERAERALIAIDKDGDLSALAKQAYTDRMRARGALRLLKHQLWEIAHCREDSARNRGKRDKMRRVLVKLGKIIDTGEADAMQQCRQIIKSVTTEIDECW
jgi:hypothetical protein